MLSDEERITSEVATGQPGEVQVMMWNLNVTFMQFNGGRIVMRLPNEDDPSKSIWYEASDQGWSADVPNAVARELELVYRERMILKAEQDEHKAAAA